jgi:hypothetical protein
MTISGNLKRRSGRGAAGPPVVVSLAPGPAISSCPDILVAAPSVRFATGEGGYGQKQRSFPSWNSRSE